MEKRQCTPNLLPCRIHHSGPTKVSKRHWTPKAEADGTQTVYFRGRKLRGRRVQVPKEYEGMFVRSVKKILSPSTTDTPTVPEAEGGEEQAPLDPESTKVLEGNASFDHLVVWGHDCLPAADDPFVRSIEEWITFAEAINKCPVAKA